MASYVKRDPLEGRFGSDSLPSQTFLLPRTPPQHTLLEKAANRVETAMIAKANLAGPFHHQPHHHKVFSAENGLRLCNVDLDTKQTQSAPKLQTCSAARGIGGWPYEKVLRPTERLFYALLECYILKHATTSETANRAMVRVHQECSRKL
eukprot:6395489-Amphidinium_carterae.1